MEDNQGKILWATSGVIHAKHVVLQRNFLREHVENGIIALKLCPTRAMTADILTKPLGLQKFES